MNNRLTLSRNTIKYLAMFTMLLNHFARVFLKNGSVLYTVFVDIGFFTAITMCYFLVEGYRYTHSVKKYALRLFVFAVISQIPYLMAFGYLQFNMLFSLLFSLCFIWINDRILNYFFKRVLQIVLCILIFYSDWSLFALIFVWFFNKNYGNREGIKRVYAVSIAAYFINSCVSYMSNYSVAKSVLLSVGAICSMVVSAVIINCFYDNKKVVKNNGFSKWFFYVFYPLHIIVLVLLRNILK